MFARMRQLELPQFNGFGLTGLILGIFVGAIAADMSTPRHKQVATAIFLQARPHGYFTTDVIECDSDCPWPVDVTPLETEPIAFTLIRATPRELLAELDASIHLALYNSMRGSQCFDDFPK